MNIPLFLHVLIHFHVHKTCSFPFKDQKNTFEGWMVGGEGVVCGSPFTNETIWFGLGIKNLNLL